MVEGAIYGELQPTWRKRPEVQAYPAGSAKRVITIYGLLSWKQDGVLMIKGTEQAGINTKQDGVDVVTGGEGSITVKQDNA
jgi:hypothetical protein